MGFKCGIVGLPNVGKSTIFNALTAAGAAAENFPFCTIDPNIGMVDVPDQRLKSLLSCIASEKILPASMEFVDIAGLVKGASKGEGLGNQFLGHIRQTDAIAHVVRCFEDKNVIHVDGDVEPLRDIDVIQSELIFSDHDTVETALTRYRKFTKSGGDKNNLKSLEMLEALSQHLQAMQPARSFVLEPFAKEVEAVAHAYRDLHLLTAKKVLYVCNVGEDLADGGEDNEFTKSVKELAAKENSEVVIICGKLEEELSCLEEKERLEMLEGLGLNESGLNRMIRKGYELLGLQTYFTAGPKEIRAWTIKRGDKAPAAAGRIHSDFQKGFICAEIYRVEDLVKARTKGKLKELGLLRTEGKEYVVQDGDVIEFRFNV